MGALGAALATMVANLSSHKPGWDERWEEFSKVAEKGQVLKDQLLDLVDEDTNAFNKIMAALQMPKKTDADKAARMEALELASQYATKVPFKTMNVAFEAFEVVEAMARTGNPASVSDAGVGALCCRSAVMGAYLNVKINAAGLKDRAFAEKIVADGAKIEAAAIKKEAEILEVVNKIINKE